MKRFDELTPEQQEKAQKSWTDKLLTAIVEGVVRFNDGLNGDDLQARIDAACDEAEKMQTPWFAGEYIMDTCREEIEGMARCDAEDAMYLEPGERVMPLEMLQS